MKPCLFCFLLVINIISSADGQTIGMNIPKKFSSHDKFLFYLHGGIVTVRGDNAVNESAPEWGPYEYSHILDSLRKRNFHVVSEMRKEGVDDAVYVKKIVRQIDSLVYRGVPPKNILVVGASAGAHIAIDISAAAKNAELHYVIMGACRPNTYKDYERKTLHGKFLSIIEKSDPHGTCSDIFKKRTVGFKEIVLTTGKSHGFLYKGYSEWIDPLVKWWRDDVTAK